MTTSPNGKRFIAARNLGIDFSVAPFYNDVNDWVGIVAGVAKRVAMALPENKLYRDMRRFSRELIRDWFEPLAPDTDISLEHWLEKTKYPNWRKNQLRARKQKVPQPTGKQLKQLETFPKVEAHMEPKIPRLINARGDSAKCEFGPTIHAIEEQVYKNPYFIKHVPVPDRPRVIQERLGRYKYIWNNDFTSFESHMVTELMCIVEFQLYTYMVRRLPNAVQLIRRMCLVLGGRNTLRAKHFKARIWGGRMSGEMSTSLGNGFTNLVVTLFAAARKGYDCEGFVEGDDSIFGSNDGCLTDQDFADLGFKTKMQILHNPGEARFCQMCFDKETLSNVPDIRRVLLKFPWTHTVYKHLGPTIMKELLRAKALSLAYEAPNSPVVRPFVCRMLEITRGYRPRWSNDGYHFYPDEKAILLLFKKGKIEPTTRALVAKTQGISVEMQLSLENELGKISYGERIDLSWLYKGGPSTHYMRFVHNFSSGESNLNL